jgi:hypothetical protein
VVQPDKTTSASNGKVQLRIFFMELFDLFLV